MTAVEQESHRAPVAAHPARRALVVRTPRDLLSFRVDRRTVVVCAALVLALVATLIAALSLGSTTLRPAAVLEALFGETTRATRTVVVDWRLPRAVLAIAFGAALGLSGAMFQSLTRNALGSPDVIGLNMGAYTGVLVVMLLGGAGWAAVATGSLVGGLATALLVYVFAFQRGVQGFRLIIVGIAFSAMLTSVNTWILVKVDVDLALRAAVWGAGTLNGVRWPQAWPPIAVMLVLCLVAVVVAPRMRQLELGDDAAATHGLGLERSKVLLIVVGIAFTALVTATAGPIAFVALAAPQVARRLTRADGTVGLVSTALVGALLLSLADVVAQHAIPGLPLPVGAVTVSIGGLYLLWLLAAETGRS
ncbi:FecCD family ABC transporter permease [Oerskovia enterophila]|uniref:FecCD family ABC transporter permease n=1 Tax=Oerskovia enterophila TaxID=43678 RepID=UPI0038063768